MVVVKSELLRSKAGERLCGTARTCGLPALERRSARVRTDCPATRSCLRTSASLNASACCIRDELVATRLSSSISLPGASSSILEIASCTAISVGYVGSEACASNDTRNAPYRGRSEGSHAVSFCWEPGRRIRGARSDDCVDKGLGVSAKSSPLFDSEGSSAQER